MNPARNLLCLSLLSVIALSGCNRVPKVDASTLEKMTASIEAMRKSINDPKQRAQLDKALTDLARFSVKPDRVIELAQSGTAPTPASAFLNVGPLVNGKTAEELIDAAPMQRKVFEGYIQSYEKELATLKKREDAFKAAASKLDAFTVVKADYKPVKSELFQQPGQGPLLELTLVGQNKGTAPIGKVVMMYEFGPEGSLSPWIRQTIEKQMTPTLEPGKDVSWTVGPFPSGMRDDLPETIKPVLDVRVTEIYGADGKPLIQVPKWGEADAVRVNLLEASVSHVRAQLAEP